MVDAHILDRLNNLDYLERCQSNLDDLWQHSSGEEADRIGDEAAELDGQILDCRAVIQNWVCEVTGLTKGQIAHLFEGER